MIESGADLLDAAATSYGSHVQPADEVVRFYAGVARTWVEEDSGQ